MSSKTTATPFWLRYLPSFLRVRVEHRPNLLKILINIGWLFADKVVRMGVGLLVVIWIARYLGPEQFGLLNYATAFIALFGAIATLGLNGIVVRDLVKEPETVNTTLGTAFLLQLLGGLIAFLLGVIVIGYVRPDDTQIRLIVALLGFVMVFKSTEVIKYWFESQVQSKYAVWVENGAFLLIAAIKLALVLNEAPLIAFVWAVLVEAALLAVGLVVMYGWSGERMGAWRVQLGRVKTLLSDSWPLILSGLAIMIYMRIDQVMLGQMLGDKAVGIYSVAVQISEVWYFVPMAITASVFPSILEAKKRGEVLYHQRLQKLFDLMVLLSIAVAIPMSFISEWLVVLLFGDEYSNAGIVLSTHIWAGVFVALGIVSGKWFLVENLQNIQLYRALGGAVINVLLNILLIPMYEEVGAAIATVISYSFAVLLLDLLSDETRIIFMMKFKSIYRNSFFSKSL